MPNYSNTFPCKLVGFLSKFPAELFYDIFFDLFINVGFFQVI